MVNVGAQSPTASHDPGIAQGADLLPRVAEFEQYFLGMLAKLRRRLGLMRNFTIERDRASGDRDPARDRMLEIEQIAIEARLLATQNLLMVRHFGREDVGRRQLLEPFSGGLAREDTIEHLLNLRAMEIAGDVVALGIVPQLLDSHDLAEARQRGSSTPAIHT